MQSVLGITPWKGCDTKGQYELFQDIGESVQRQLEGLPATKIFRVEAGHGVGKTFGAAALVNWFFDAFEGSIIITTAPTADQVELLLWKDIKTQREGKGLPGKVDPENPRMKKAANWFAIGRTTSDAGGKGTARMQGQHPPFWMYVLDEAEGVADFVFGAVDGMMTGGQVGIVLMFANPQTRTSKFHKKGRESGVANYRLSVLDHPNVVSGREVVPGATKREWAQQKIADWCEVVTAHDEDSYTFTVPYEVEQEGVVLPPGAIFKPNPEFCFRVLGIAPANLADRTFISPGRYEAAKTRVIDKADALEASIGVDCARFGADAGTIYVNHLKVVRRAAQVYKADTNAYVEEVKKAAKVVAAAGARILSIRVDGTGGFGAGSVDALRSDEELKKLFDKVRVFEVQFGASALAEDKYADKVTEMYAQSAESLKGLRLEGVPAELEGDLTERHFEYINRAGKILKKLVDKEKFRKDHKRSPDDGDGFVLATAPEFIFTPVASALAMPPALRIQSIPGIKR